MINVTNHDATLEKLKASPIMSGPRPISLPDLLAALEGSPLRFDPGQRYPGGEKIYFVSQAEMLSIKSHLRKLHNKESSQ